jgi:serine/threonine protein kinase
MTTPSTLSEFVAALRDHDLLDARHVEEFESSVLPRHDDVTTLGRVLVERGWMTPFQIDWICAGRAADLRLGSYRLLHPLGEGGMGQVFQAKHQRLQRIVALKVIRQDVLSRDPEAIRRFQREAEAAAQLSHPNVVLVYDADQAGDTHFIAMEYVEGVDLHRLVRDRGPLTFGCAIEFIRQAALGLQHAHEHGMVHRDIKPSNLLVTRPDDLKQSRVKILDLGLARLARSGREGEAASQLTRLGVVMGTPDFIAPEQARNSRDVDIRADLYSLGCTLYYLLTGRPPFPEGTVVEKLLMHQLDAPRPVCLYRADTPLAIERIVERLLAKQPVDRFQTPAELVEVLGCLQLEERELPPARKHHDSAELALGSTAVVPIAPRIISATPGVRVTATTDTPVAGMVDASATPHGQSSETPMVARHDPPHPFPRADGVKRIATLAGHHGCVLALAFAPNRDLLASGGVDGQVRLWSFTSRLPSELTLADGRRGEIYAVAFAPDNRTLAFGAGTIEPRLCLARVSERGVVTLAAVLAERSLVKAIAFSPDGNLLAAAGHARTIRLWDLGGAAPRELATLHGHDNAVQGLAFTPDRRFLASASHDGTLRLWSLARGKPHQAGVLKGHTGPVHAVAFAPDGCTFASGGLDQSVRLWKLGQGDVRLLAVLEAHSQVVRHVLFPEPETVVSVGDRGQVLTWDVQSGQARREVQLPETMVSSLALTHDGRYLAAGKTDGSITVHRLHPRSAATPRPAAVG